MGEVTKEEFRRLRDEVRDARDLARATLMAIVGSETRNWEIESRVQHRLRFEQAGPRLAGVIGYVRAERIWKEFEVAAVRGLRQIHREEVAALPGVGPATMDKLDAALTAEDVEWGDWVAAA